MAISSRLARKFQQTLGNDAAEDLVHWMDDVDEQRREMRSELAELRQEMRSGLAELRQEMRAGFAAARQQLSDSVHRLELADANIRTEIANVNAAVANARADLIKWSFVFWAVTLGAVVFAR